MTQLTKKQLTNKIQASFTLEGTVNENVESIKFIDVAVSNYLKWNTFIKDQQNPWILRQTLFFAPKT